LSNILYRSVNLCAKAVRAMNQIEKLKYMIREYKEKRYATSDFCDLFVDILYHQKDGSIKDEEFAFLDKFGDVFARYSPYEEDVKPGGLFNEERVLKEFQTLLSEWCD